MAEIAYRDFDLYLERWEGRFRASVRESPAGAASTAFELPFSPVKLENFLLRLGRVRRGVRRMESAETQAAKELGGALFEAVFAGELRACLRSSLDEVARERRGLRIRLHVDDAELASLPWEYLYYASRSQFLALSVHTPLVRYLDLPEPIPALTIEPPLRVLVMISSPTDHPALDVEREWRVLNDAVGTLHPSRRVVCDRLDEATLHALQRRLRRRPYHVFHFIGHGGYDREHDEGLLLLEDEAHKGHPVSSRTIGMLLRDHRPLRVVVLNACEGARASLVDPFAGSAQTLVQQGLPAVIAMQFEIGDEVATTFAQEFYGALSDGYPVDAAVTESRKAICAAGHDVEWGTPVLYMRSPDGRIFDMVPRTNPTVTAPAPDPGGSRAAAGVAAALAPVPSAREGPAASDESAERAARTALAKAHVEWHLEHGLLEDAETALVDALCVFPDDAALTSLRARVDEARGARAGEGSGDPERRRLSETDTLEGR